MIISSLDAYYDALDAGRADEAAECFTPEVVYAVPRAGLAEIDARRVIEGRAALRAYFLARGRRPHRHETLALVTDADTCLFEGVLRETDSGAIRASFTASARVGADGLVERYVAFATEPAIVPGPGPLELEATADARLVADRYFAHLDVGEFEAAAACFSPGVLYSHPPYRHTGIDSDARVEFRGRAELLEAFLARGKRSFGHRILRCAQRGRVCLFEGVVEDLPGGGSGSFISSLTLDVDGLIDRYASFYCEPSVPF